MNPLFISAKEKEGSRIVSDLSLVSSKEWGAFVVSHPQGNIFQSPEIVDLYLKTGVYDPLCLFSLDDEDVIDGLVVAYVISDGSLAERWASSRAIIMGGPLVKKGGEAKASELIKSLKEIVSGKVTFIQFRNLFDTSSLKSSFTKNRFAFEEHLDILFDLTKTEAELWHAVHPTRRKQINRSEKRGVEVAIQDTPDSKIIGSCYSILETVYFRAKLPCPSRSFFEDAFELLSAKKMIKAFLAVYDNEIIGFRFVLLYGGMVYDWYAGSDQRFNDRYPNDILPWAIIKWGREQGFRTFDFGGAGHPREKYGVRDYKIKFGGKIVDFGRYLFVNRPIVYYPAKWYMKIRKKSGKSENTD